jgi:transposase-like protein
MRRRRTYDAAFRARVALEAIKNTRTLAEISGEYKVHPNMIVKWKKEVISKLPLLFQKADNTGIIEAEEKIDELYREIGKLKVESDYLKKKLLS